MIKPEQNSKVEKTHLLLPLNRKRKKTQNLHNTLQLNTMEENITVNNVNKKSRDLSGVDQSYKPIHEPWIAPLALCSRTLEQSTNRDKKNVDRSTV